MAMSIQLDDERGQAVPLVLALVAVAIVLTVAFGVFAGDVVDAGRARTAADAAALAGVEGGRAASVRLAAAHDGIVTAWRRQGRVVTVTVRVGAMTASARATGGPIDADGPAAAADARPRSRGLVAYAGPS
ncbi:MAG: hypothetical protein ABW219_02005 [Ilumatobacteraceae bacterium]